MTSATHFKRGKIAFALGAILLLTAVTPFALVTAQNNATEPDDLVVVITPRNGIPVSDGKLGVAAIGTMFVFDYQLFHADGTPFLISQYSVDVHTIDGRTTENVAADWPTLIYEDVVDVAPSSTGTIRIPAAAVTWYTPKDPDYYHEMPFGGMSLVFHARADADGTPFTGDLPNGAYNIATADLAASGSWAEAGMADEQFTPLLLFNGQLSGLVQFANPVLNPGFEIGYQSDSRCCGGQADIPGFSSAIPPWFMFTNTGKVPQSTHYIQGSAGSSGSAVAVRYSTADNAEGAHFGQLFFEPNTTKIGPWYGSDSVKLQFDMRARNEGSASMPNYHGLVTLHWADAACPNSECQKTIGPAGGVALDDAWRAYTIDFGAIANGKQLNSVFFSFNLNGATAPVGSQLVVHIDNVRLTGAKVTSQAIEPRNDLTDGFSTFVLPANTAISATPEQVVAQLTDLNGDDAYVFRLSAMDYTGISVEEVDVVGSAYSVFQILDETYVQTFIDGGSTGSTNTTNTKFFAVTGGENGDAFYQFLDSEGNVADEYLVVVPASMVSGAVAVPHLFVDVATDDAYAPTYGAATEPAHGFYSAARNNLMLTHLADSMDYSFTPMVFSSNVGAAMIGTTSIALDCPIASVTVHCASDTTPDLRVTVGSDSPILETATVKLVSDALAARADPENYTDGVVAEGVVSLPSGGITLTLTESAMENLTAVADLSVRAVTEGARFTGPAQTDLLKLDNFRPVAQFEHGSLDNLVKGSVVTFTDTSFDTDGVIERSNMSVTLLYDPSPNDADPTPPGWNLWSNTGSLTVTIPDDGVYQAKLDVRDDGGLTDEITLDFVVKNQKPVISISGPQFGRPGDLLTFTYTMDDVDGIIVGQHKVGHEMEQGLTRPAALPYTVVFTDNGTKTIWVNARDDDGARTNQSFTVLIDDELPSTGIELLTQPAFGANGWYAGPVEFQVTRADVGDTASGVAQTTIVVVDNATGLITSTESVGGDENLTRTVSGDGVHIVKAFTKDRAGNSDELAEINATVMIDTSKPEVTIIQPQLVDGDSPLAGVFFTDEEVDIVVDANDPHSAVTKVEFFVDGGDAVGFDDDGADGWSFKWLASGSGTHEIAVVATNAAGLREISQTITVLVI